MTTDITGTPPPPPPPATASQDGLRSQAREVYRQSVAAEMPLTGTKLGEMFGRSDRWGRERITEVRAENHPDTAEPPSVTPAAAVPVAGNLLPETGMPAVGAVPVAPSPPEVGVAQPPGARAVVWTAFLLGIGASLAANVAHATPSLGPRLAAGFVPLALLLAVECMTRPAWNRTGRLWGLARYGGTGLVAVVAAVMSYRHMHGLLLVYGEDPFTAALGPLAIDGLMIVAGFALLATAPATRGRGDGR